MGKTLKLLLLLSVVNLGVSALVHRRIGTLESKKSCGEGQYYSQEAGFCYDCKTCDDFYFQSQECTETTDTVCKWCGIELNFAEESEDVLDDYEDKCMIGRMEYIHKREYVDQMKAAEKYGSDSEEGREVKETEEETDRDMFQSGEEVSEESNRKKFAKELEEKIARENEIHHDNLCQEGQYFNYQVGRCFDCTTCGHFLYETAKCTKSSNTVCTWCGKEPKFDAITDIVLASYQNKCLMVQLDFVDMNELFDSEEEESVSEEDFYDSEEDSDVEEDEIDAKVRVAMEKKEEDDLVRTLALKSGQRSVEEDSKQEPEEEAETVVTDEEVDKYLEKSISESVHEYFIEMNKKYELKYKSGDNVKKAELKLPYEDAVYDPDDFQLSYASSWLMSRPLVPEDSTSQEEEDSTEEIDDRIIRWDKWVDDEVKPIRAAEIVEAEEISPYEEIVVVAEKEEMSQEKTLSNSVLMFCVCLTIFTLGYAFFACKRVPKHRHVFHGVPVDSPDYHMILHASRHIEELEKKEKKASRHVHENPIFDI